MSERILKVNQLIKKELAEIILREVDFSFDVLITVTRVEASSNLREAKVYVSVMPENKAKEVLDNLKAGIYDIQGTLNKRVNMRPLPRIRFIIETKTREAGRIEELLEKIKKKG